ncbi:MAG: helix-turn-helix domain-containing protein [Clostridia bacterium]|nr:helix-turn-helix domain-containing protein [Clostridia bacterium]
MNILFCERLKDLRKEKGIGQTHLAELCGVSKGIISLWENGLREPTMGNLIKLAKIFEVSIDYLVGISDY